MSGTFGLFRLQVVCQMPKAVTTYNAHIGLEIVYPQRVDLNRQCAVVFNYAVDTGESGKRKSFLPRSS